MRIQFASAILMIMVGNVSAQSYVANEGYTVCPPELTQAGLEVVQEQCGSITRPNYSSEKIGNYAELQAAQSMRDRFQSDAKTYSDCVDRFVQSYRRPGADANSDAPDRAACAHSWAQDQATKSVREYGRLCIDFADRSLMDPAIEPYNGQCYFASAIVRG